MKITGVKTVLLTAPQCDLYMTARGTRSAAFILIETDTEHVGIGETYAGYFCPELIPNIVDFYAPILIGQNPLDIDTLTRRMFNCGKFWARVGLGSIVLSGLEMALLDLKGKTYDLPVYELLGGRCHDKLPCYATGGPSLPESQLEKKVSHYLSLGFRKVKLGAGVWEPGKPIFPHASATKAAEVEVKKLEFLRARFGPGTGIMMDAHMDNLPDDCHIWDEGAATTVLQSIESYGVEFFEEPLPYTNKRAYKALRGKTAVKVAGGECLTSFEEWRDWMDEDPFGLAQLDASFMGGLTNFVKIARLCEARDIPIATHAWSGAVGLAGNLHAAFACRNTKVVEMPAFNPAQPELNTHWTSPLLSDLWVTPPEIRNGELYLSDAPGLGIKLPSEIINGNPFRPGTGEVNDVPGKKCIV